VFSQVIGFAQQDLRNQDGNAPAALPISRNVGLTRREGVERGAARAVDDPTQSPLLLFGCGFPDSYSLQRAGFFKRRVYELPRCDDRLCH